MVFIAFSITIITSSEVSAFDVINDITYDTTWSSVGNPWMIRNDIIVENDITLTLDAGVEVRFGGHFSLLCQGNGKIVANGLGDNMIVITSNNPGLFNYSTVSTGIGGMFRNCSISHGDNSLSAADDAIIVDCLFFSSPKGIEVVGDRVTVQSCNMSNCEYGIYAVDCSQASIEDCVVSYCTKGINLIGTTNDTIVKGCYLYNCAIRGIEIETSGFGNSVEHCRFESTRAAILIWKSKDVNLFDLRISNCTYGIGIFEYIDMGAYPITIRRCVVTNAQKGLELSDAKWTEVNDSTFSNNDVGISEWKDSGPGITIWNNNFLGNKDQVDVDTDVINWSFNGSGNYWSDYQGPDSNGDGIGDYPYNVSTTSRDDYPLMEPMDFEYPVAIAGPDITIRQHSQFHLDGTQSFDDTWIQNWSWVVNLSGEEYILNGEEVTYSIAKVGTYQITLTVWDAVGKTGTDSLDIVVTDGERPRFLLIDFPTTIFTGDVLNISCEVIDNVGVDKVVLDLTLGSGLPERLDLARVSEGLWVTAVPIPIDLQEEIYFILLAGDATGNINTTDYFTIQVLDDRIPLFDPDLPEHVNTGNYAHLNCSISDNWGIVNATVEYWFPNGLVTSQNLTKNDVNWSIMIYIPEDAISPMRVQFNALDLGGNLGSSPIIDVEVIDDDPPELTGYSTSPITERFHKGESVYFEVSFADNIGIESAYLDIRFYSTEWQSIPLEKGDGIYHTTIAIATDLSNRLWFRFNASDEAGNILITGDLEVQLLSENPVITTEPAIEVYEGEPYNVPFEAIDPDNDAAELTWQMITNASWLVFDAASAVLHGNPMEDDIGVYSVNITVEDGDGGLDGVHYQITVLGFNFPPFVEIRSPEDGVKAGSILMITGRAADDDDTIHWVRLRIDDGDWVDIDGTTIWNYELNTDDLNEGIHNISVMAYDGVSESEVASITFVVPEQEDTGLSGIAIFGILIVIAFVIFLVIGFYIMRGRRKG